MTEDDDPRPRLAYDRTILANERTFAAWVRTGLAVAAVGVAVAHLIPMSHDRALHLLIAGLFVALGIVVIGLGAWRFARVYRDLRGTGSPPVVLAPVVVYGVSIVLALLLGALLFLR